METKFCMDCISIVFISLHPRNVLIVVRITSNSDYTTLQKVLENNLFTSYVNDICNLTTSNGLSIQSHRN